MALVRCVLPGGVCCGVLSAYAGIVDVRRSDRLRPCRDSFSLPWLWCCAPLHALGKSNLLQIDAGQNLNFACSTSSGLSLLPTTILMELLHSMRTTRFCFCQMLR